MVRKINNVGNSDRCNKKRAFGIDIKDISKEQFQRVNVTREAIKLYKFDKSVTLSDVDNYIEEKFKDLDFPNDYVKMLNMDETKTLVHKYLEADGRKAYPSSAVTFKFGGEELSYRPSFVYYEEAEVYNRNRKGKITVPVVEVVNFTAGKQKFTNGSNYGSGKETVSLHHNLEGLGLLMSGKELLKGKAGIVRCCADSLKTNLDTHGDYSREWAVAETDKSGTKSSHNRNWFEVFFTEKGKIVPLTYLDRRSGGRKKVTRTGYYVNIGDNKKLKYDNSLLFKQYKETLKNFLLGKDGCSKENCRKECEFFELCYYNHQPVSKNEVVKEQRVKAEPKMNLQQKEVVDFRNGICVCDAGPGSGKTQTMAFRIAKMIEEGTDPKNILVMSFSKSAVKVITDRVDFFVNDVYGLGINIDKIKVATFNSLGDELIKKNYKVLGYTEEPDLVDEVEMFDILKDAIDFDNPVEGFDYKNYSMKSMNRNQQGGVVFEIMNEISEIRQEGLTKEQYMDKPSVYNTQQKEYIWNTNLRYSESLIKNNKIDYSDQQYQVLRLIDEINPEAIVEAYRYEHIVVDEFQDSNDFQMIFIRELMNTTTFKSLLVVGDDSQSIYAFRHTTPDNIINFEEKVNVMMPVKELYMSVNYRSSEEIVELGNEIISHNKTNIQKRLTSNMGKTGNKPIFKGFEKSADEINYICDNIENLIKSGVEKDDIAVICATKSSLKSISKELSARGILSQYDMGERLLDNSRVRASIGFCNFVTEPSSNRGLLEYINEVYNNKLFDLFTSTRVESILNTAREDFLNAYLPLSLDEKKEYIIRALELLDDGTDSIYRDFVTRIKDKKKHNVFELLNYIRKFYELGINATAEKDGKYDAVAIVTAHSSKGKEWEHCFVSLSDFDKVSASSLQEKEEKRRLIFVACTRAKVGLTVTTLRNKDREGDRVPVNPWYIEMKNYSSFDNQDCPISGV